MTYRKLKVAANRLGHMLQSQGVEAEKIVSLILNRGVEVYIARQGILSMANEAEIYNSLSLKAPCEKNGVDVMSCTPSYLANLIDLPELESIVKKIKSVDFGAKAFSAALFTKLRVVNPEIYIMNGYDPTEATISCTMKAIESPENITIGIPNANVQVVMLDEKNHLLPIGALGELTILGDGVGRGYINRDDLTREKFITLWGKLMDARTIKSNCAACRKNRA